MNHVFGPVPSRRLGNSLGVDLVPFKTCSFDCVYCQLGRTSHQTAERQSFVSPEAVVAEVRDTIARGVAIDYITFSGSGEPTLSLDIGPIMRAIQGFADIPVAVLTNSSLLGRDEVRLELAPADLVVPSFDAGTQQAFERMNRPLGMSVGDLASGIVAFTRGFGGQVWLEVMIVRGVNDTVAEAEAIVAALDGGRFHRVQLNTVVRAPADADAGPAGAARLAELAAVLEQLAPVDVIGAYEGGSETHDEWTQAARDDIMGALARRPCGVGELAASLGLRAAVVGKYVEALERDGRIERIVVGGAPQFRVPHAEG
ncbi:MAG: radical SAM protein [Candidatus Brocadiae bacterium]|nr:radical SAM protein [Candidatus Brocadiia bacterium]